MNEKEYNKKKKYLFDYLQKYDEDICIVEDFREKKEDEYEDYVGCYYIVDYVSFISDSKSDGEEDKKCLVDKKVFDKYFEKKEKEKKIIIWLD